ncbi:hypothetical protein VTL71DRAFT_6506 [Oculimacula yallundae]|uniref:C2H2-type domain-containing protein n=1 Tax=Oculimacula yallundae TaxID=86028 RepID=A0ABR4BX57_9HELO
MDFFGDHSIDIDCIPPGPEFQVLADLKATELYDYSSESSLSSVAMSLDPPMTFRNRHRFLDEVYNSYPDPEHISAKDLVCIARQAGICMEEAHAWFEDETHRRSKLSARFQNQTTNEPRLSSPESMIGYASGHMNISEMSGSSQLFSFSGSYYEPTPSIFSGPSSPGTVSGEHLQIPPRARHCGKSFSASRWSEHVKRVHFPDYIWECPKTHCEWKPFYRTDNFITHLLREHRCDEFEIAQLRNICKFAVVDFYHKTCGFCSLNITSRDGCIDHIKEHLKEISCRDNPPVDLGLSEWKEQCSSTHILQRGVHYQLKKSVFRQEPGSRGRSADGDPDPDSSGGQNQDGSNQTMSRFFQEGENGNNAFFGSGGPGYSQGYDYHSNRVNVRSNEPPATQQGTNWVCGSKRLVPRNIAASAIPATSYPVNPYSTALPPGFDMDRLTNSSALSMKGRCIYPECGKIFKDLKAHMLTHQNERPEKCPIQTCEYHIKGFARKYDKNRHTLTHYKGLMVCGLCPGSGTAAAKSFNRVDVFKRHLTSIHAVEQTPPNSRKKSSTTQPSSAEKKLSGYAPDATGKCSTCSASFYNAQDFYEHLDECVLRIVQQEEPSDAINSARLAEVANGDIVHEVLWVDTLLSATANMYSPEESPEGHSDGSIENDILLDSDLGGKPKIGPGLAGQGQEMGHFFVSKDSITTNNKARQKKGLPSASLESKASVSDDVNESRQLGKKNLLDVERQKLSGEYSPASDQHMQTSQQADLSEDNVCGVGNEMREEA